MSGRVLDQRTKRNIGGSGPSADALAAADYDKLQNVGEGAFRSSLKYRPINGSQRTAFVPMARGKAKPIQVPWDLDMSDPTHVHLAATHGAATKQIKSSERVLNITRRRIRLTGGHASLNEEIRALGIDLRKAAGEFTLKAGGISVNSANGKNPLLHIEGRNDGIQLGGFHGRVDAKSGTTMSRANLNRAAITFVGSEATPIAGAHTDGFTANKRSYSATVDGIMKQALDSAAREKYHPEDGVSGGFMPSASAMRQAVAQHGAVGPRPAISNHVTALMANALAQQSRDGMQSNSVRRKNRNWDADISAPAPA